jgi:radical SAM-linked protein
LTENAEELHLEIKGTEPESAQRLRLRFAKKQAMKYLSHLGLLNVFTRAVSRGGVPILFSQGFHPHPRFSFATATSVGVESNAEYMDMSVKTGITAEEVKDLLNEVLPSGLHILEAHEIDPKSLSLSATIAKTRYRITLDESWSKKLHEHCVQFLAHESFVIQRKKKGEVQSIDLRAQVSSLTTTGNSFDLVAGRGKPMEFVAAITGDPELQADDVLIEKLEVIFMD